MQTIILGAGIAGLSLANFLKRKTIILEKEAHIGGLCRSFNLNGIFYDVGPHIMFSKNKQILELHKSLVKTNEIKRSNKIYHKGKLIKYPFENDLSSLDISDRNYCLQEFLNNPYENYEPQNMLQFFLKTFGEGITNLYLKPYNEKIWKYDPAFLDTQMVDRIPKPPKEDVIKSAHGKQTEGYLHQLYFQYPHKGGFQSLVNAYKKKINKKSEILTAINIKEIRKNKNFWEIITDKKKYRCKELISCIPLHELIKIIDAPKSIQDTVGKLKYNSIHIVMIQVKKDNIGDNFALYFPDKDVIFHRMSKLNFLGKNYCLEGGKSTLMFEITFRPDSYLSSFTRNDIIKRVINDAQKLNFINKKNIIDTEVRSFKYTYVIYDLNHRKNTDVVLSYLKSIGIESSGRFAEFEYMNSDMVVEHSYNLASKLNQL